MTDTDTKMHTSALAPQRTNAALRPIYLLVVFWGDVHRNYFANLLLPSLLAPGNLPAISSVQGSKLVICTTRADWGALQTLPLFKSAQKYVEPLWIEIEAPQSKANKYMHSAAAFKRAVQQCWRDRALASFLVPDLILSDGTLRHLRNLAVAGAVAVLAPALRYDLEGCVAALRNGGLMEENREIAVSSRQLVGIGLANLHSEIRRFEWDSPHFCREPISVWWRLPDKDRIILHTTAWQMALVNFNELPALNDSSLDYTSHDGPFIEHNFFRFRDRGALHLIGDSDDSFWLSLTSEADMSFLPLKRYVVNRIPGIAARFKLIALQVFLNGPLFDTFRRWAVTIPVFIHAAPLDGTERTRAVETSSLLQRAVTRPPALPRLYGWIPSWPQLRRGFGLLFTAPSDFGFHLARYVNRRRQAS